MFGKASRNSGEYDHIRKKIGKKSAIEKTAEKREGKIVTLRCVELIANKIR